MHSGNEARIELSAVKGTWNIKPRGRRRKDRGGGLGGHRAGGAGQEPAAGPGGVVWEETNRIKRAEAGRMGGRPRPGKQ